MRQDINIKMRRLNFISEIKPNFAEIAREMNCDYRTAKKHYYNDDTTKKERKKRDSKLTDNNKKIISDKFLEFSATASAIYLFLRKRHKYEGGYGLVKNYVKELKSEKKKKATVRVETKPGIQAQVDWKEEFKLYNKNRDEFCINIFLYTLGYSRTKKLIITFDRKQDTLFNALKESFEYTGGVPEKIVFDNMRTVVDKPRTVSSEAIVNDKMKQFAKDMGFNVSVCRSYRPQTKGKVESVAKLMDRLLVYNLEFEKTDELLTIVDEFNNEVNEELCSATNQKACQLLEHEKEYLSPLPSKEILDSYITQKVYRKVNKESFIQYQGNKYSVDPRFIDKFLEIKIVNQELCIYNNTELVRCHPISVKKYNYNQSDLKGILKSDAYKYKTDEEIEQYIDENLRDLDMILIHR